MAPLQLHMRSAGEVSPGQVSSHASSLYPTVFWPLWLDEELGNQNTWWHYLKDASCALKWEGSLPVYLQTLLLNTAFLEMQKCPGILARCLRTDSETMGREGPLECWSAMFCCCRHLLVNSATSIHKTSKCLLSLLLLEGCFKALLSHG